MVQLSDSDVSDLSQLSGEAFPFPANGISMGLIREQVRSAAEVQ
jgi:hypothetical protein